MITIFIIVIISLACGLCSIPFLHFVRSLSDQLQRVVIQPHLLLLNISILLFPIDWTHVVFQTIFTLISNTAILLVECAHLVDLEYPLMIQHVHDRVLLLCLLVKFSTVIDFNDQLTV